MSSEPVASLVILCDHVVVEQGSGKNSLIGVFHHLVSPAFPFIYQRMFAHIMITNFLPEGKPINLAVNLKNKDTGAVISSVGFPINLPMPANRHPDGVRLAFNLPIMNVTFPSPGKYCCEVLFNSEPIGSAYLDIVPQQNPPPGTINPQPLL